MPLGPVAATRADKAVVAPYIHNTVAETAEVLGFKYGHAYPSLDHGLAVEGIDIPVRCIGRDRVEPLTSAAGGGEVDVRLAGEISTINERLPGVFVQAGGQGFLCWRLAERQTVQTIRVVDTRIEVLRGKEQGPGAGIPSVVRVELGAEFVACGARSQVSCRAVVTDAAYTETTQLG